MVFDHDDLLRGWWFWMVLTVNLMRIPEHPQQRPQNHEPRMTQTVMRSVIPTVFLIFTIFHHNLPVTGPVVPVDLRTVGLMTYIKPWSVRESIQSWWMSLNVWILWTGLRIVTMSIGRHWPTLGCQRTPLWNLVIFSLDPYWSVVINLFTGLLEGEIYRKASFFTMKYGKHPVIFGLTTLSQEKFRNFSQAAKRRRTLGVENLSLGPRSYPSNWANGGFDGIQCGFSGLNMI